MASEQLSGERRDTVRRRSPPTQLRHCRQPSGPPQDCQPQASTQHQNAERAASSRDKAHLTNTGSGHLQGVRRRNPRACAGSDQSELAWLLPTNPSSYSVPCCHPGKLDFPPYAFASHKNASLVIKGHLATKTLELRSCLTQAGTLLEKRDEQNGEMEAQRGQRACLW